MNSKLRFAFQDSFSFRVLSAFILVIIFVLTAFTLAAVVREGREVKRNLMEQGETLAGLLGDSTALGVFAEDRQMLQQESEGILGLKDVVSLSIYNADQRLLYRRDKGSSNKDATPAPGSRDGAPDTSRSLNIVETAETFVFTRPVVLRSDARAGESLYFDGAPASGTARVIGYARIVLSKRVYYQKIAAIVAQNAVVMLVFIVAGSLVVFFTIKKITRPLEKLTDKVETMGKGLPVEPMEVETHDEVGKLATAFNAMVVARGQAEESLRQSEHRFRLIAETITDVFWMSDVGLKKMLYISPQYERVWGRSRESLYEDPRSFLDAIHPEDQGRVLFDYEAKKSGKPFEHEYRIIRPDGSIRLIVDRGYPVHNDEGAVICYVGAAHDITERKGMEAQIQTYQNELRETSLEMSSMESRIEKRERYLIAADLHDFVGQNLVVSNFKLGILRKYVSATDGDRHLEELQELIRQTIQYTRSLTVELSPHVLFEVGFTAAIESLAGEFQKAHKLSINVKDDGLSRRIDDDTRYLLFRCVRELLMNAVKHSKASSVTISIATQDALMKITVEDNGIGFDAMAVNGKQGGFGLFSIRERLKRLGGCCEIVTGPGSGTAVLLAAPIKQ